MKIKIKDNGKSVLVDVADSCCAKYKCFYPHRWITQSKNNNYAHVDKSFSCGTRNYHGCPDQPEPKDAPLTTNKQMDTIEKRMERIRKRTKDAYVNGIAPRIGGAAG